LRSVAVLGYSDTGKTTFIEVLTRRAATAGIPTAVVKYSRHPGDFDAPGSDTARFAATPARFVAYRGRDRWFLSAPGGDVQEGADRAPDERAEIPPWLALLGDDVDLLILEGRRRDDSIICLTTGNSQRVDELKFPVEIADIVISASRSLEAEILARQHPPLVARTNDEAAQHILGIFQQEGGDA
jgi:molybdopterin-guanine dinucleotide biosynthesis protein MobB